jgi:D-cysteine desulfhydrase
MSQPRTLFAEITLPSPIRTLYASRTGATLWVKDDSGIHRIYGGNKCRKLAHILRAAEQQRKRRIVTFGAAGSHHVLATALLARSLGFEARAFVVPQPWSSHAEQVLRASCASGIELIPVLSLATAARAAIRMIDLRSMFVPPGGSNVCGGLGYFEAAIELAQQVRRGELPEPDYIVLAFGTGGTAAGLLAGAAFAGLKSTIVGVSVLRGAGRALYARRLANSILRSAGAGMKVGGDNLVIDTRWLGAGYGIETEPGKLALARGASLDLPLDPSYTAKAFAGALALIEGRKQMQSTKSSANGGPFPKLRSPCNHVLYWHTLSAPRTLQIDAAAAAVLPRKLQDLLTPCRLG